MGASLKCLETQQLWQTSAASPDMTPRLSCSLQTLFGSYCSAKQDTLVMMSVS
jgi:hypothetical protein